MFVCLSVCLFVCLFVCLSVGYVTTFSNLDKYRHIIYESNRNFNAQVLIYISSPDDQPSGRYWTETGQRWKKMIKNRRFLTILWII